MDKDETVSAAFLLIFTNDVLGNFLCTERVIGRPVKVGLPCNSNKEC